MGTMGFRRFVAFMSTAIRLAASARREEAIDTSTYAGTRETIQITYVRHGQSAGNAGGLQHIKDLDRHAHFDGKLTEKGEKQVKDRVEKYSQEMVTNIVNTQLVMVSPLRRAMATAVLLLAHCKYKELQAKSSSALELSNSQVSLGKARNRSRSTPKCIELDDASNTWPSFQVVAELREKRKTESEDPGSHGKPMTYIEQTVEKISKKLFCRNMF
eukprot:TRINITY_DN2762_c0_g2_i1.p1 TRINITY_DN2762_c0_g2~~TRINITY_DN2762_c0_g2_i1.p1  ORF type:complete len:215 (-),score=35.37 TRINITY_DN2762_c0_g2_i1:236-880(-)